MTTSQYDIYCPSCNRKIDEYQPGEPSREPRLCDQCGPSDEYVRIKPVPAEKPLYKKTSPEKDF